MDHSCRTIGGEGRAALARTYFRNCCRFTILMSPVDTGSPGTASIGKSSQAMQFDCDIRKDRVVSNFEFTGDDNHVPILVSRVWRTPRLRCKLPAASLDSRYRRRGL